MNIRLQYSVTPDDYYEFQMAYMKHRKSLTPAGQRGLRSPMIVVWIVAVLMILGFCVVSDWFAPAPAPPPVVPGAPAPPPPSWSAFFLSLLPYLVMFAVVWGFLLWVRRSKFIYRRLAPQGTRIGEPRTAEITDGQITLRETGMVTVMEWPYFIRCIETRSVFLLFSVPRMGHILPKRAFPSSEALHEFRAFAQAHIGNLPVGFPVQPPIPPPVQPPMLPPVQ